MKVLISCGTKFHSDHLAYQMQQRNSLDKVITAHPPFAYKRVPLQRKKILFLPPIFVLSWIFDRLLGKRYFFKSPFEWLLGVIYDWMASLFVGKPDVSISWAWASLRTIHRVQGKGGIAILEECASCKKYQDELLRDEYVRLNLSYDSKIYHKIIERELQECHAADYILCPSKYVAESFSKCSIPWSKLMIVPYGVDLTLFHRVNKTDDIFRVLFVGTVGVRKGLIYLFQALCRLNLPNFECVIIGRIEPAFQEIFNSFQTCFKHIPWVEHTKLKDYYSNASIFVFPSLDEGMAYVQLEAMACGLPVICTPNSGGDSVIREDIEGFIIPIRDSYAIQEKIEYLYNHPDELRRMSQNALIRAKEFTWDRYGAHLEIALHDLLSEKNNEQNKSLSN